MALKPLRQGFPSESWTNGELRALLGRLRDEQDKLLFPTALRDRWILRTQGERIPTKSWNKEQLMQFVKDHADLIAQAQNAQIAAAPTVPVIPAPAAQENAGAHPKYVSRKHDRHVDKVLQDARAQGAPFPPMLLVGETGTGKTHCAAQVAERLGLPALVISFSKDTPLRSLFARTALEEGPQGGTRTIEAEQELTKMLQIPSVIVLDELNMLPGGHQSKLFELLNNRAIYLPELDRTVTMHPACLIVGTCNPKSPAYTGTTSFNPALIERQYLVIKVPFFTQAQLERLTGLDSATCKYLIELRTGLLEDLSPAVYGVRTCLNFKEHIRLFGRTDAVHYLQDRLELLDPNARKAIEAHTAHYWTTIAEAPEESEDSDD